MITAEHLLKLLAEFKVANEKAVYSSELDPDAIALMKTESLLTQTVFIDIHQQLSILEKQSERDPRAIAEIRDAITNYLKVREHNLMHTNIFYFRHPFLPANQLCVQVAEAICLPDDSARDVLIPYIDSVTKKYERDLIASYFLNENSYHDLGRESPPKNDEAPPFAIEQYCLSHANHLIPVAEIFERAKLNTDRLFPEFQKAVRVDYQLHPQDFVALYNVAGQASHNYMRALSAAHRRRYDDQTVGFAIHHLAVKLERSANASDASQADSTFVAETILDFYHYWFALPPAIRDQLGKLRVEDHSDNDLESYLLMLFAGHYQCVLRPEYKAKLPKSKANMCIGQIADSLYQFLEEHNVSFKIQPLLNEEFEIQNLHALATEAIKALSVRQQITKRGGNYVLSTDLVHRLSEELQEVFVELLIQNQLIGSVKLTNIIQPYLKSKPKDQLIQAYAEHLAKSITNQHEFVNAIKNPENWGYIDYWVPLLKGRFNTLISSEDSALRLISLVKSAQHQINVIGELEPKLKVWIQQDPQKYLRITPTLKDVAQTFFSLILAQYIPGSLRNLKQCTACLRVLSPFPFLQVMPLQRLVASKDDLIMILASLSSKEDRMSVLSRFNHQQLRCSVAEFEKVKNLIDQPVLALISLLQNYLDPLPGQQPNPSGVLVVVNMMQQCLDNPYMSKEEVRALILDSFPEVREEYSNRFWKNSSNNQFDHILKQTLSASPPIYAFHGRPLGDF